MKSREKSIKISIRKPGVKGLWVRYGSDPNIPHLHNEPPKREISIIAPNILKNPNAKVHLRANLTIISSNSGSRGELS